MLRKFPAAIYLIIITTSVVLCTLVGHLITTSASITQHERNISDLASITIRRAENIISQGAEVASRYSRGDFSDCGSVSLQRMRFQIYQDDQAKDIRMTDANGQVICSAFPETLEFDRSWPAIEDMLRVEGTDFRLFRVDQFGGEALGVLAPVGEKRNIAVIVALNKTILDVFPEGFRNGSSMTVSLSNGQVLAQLTRASTDSTADEVQYFTNSSSAYPITVSVSVPEAAMVQWVPSVAYPILAFAVALGGVIGFAIAQIATRGENPLAALDKGISNGEFLPFFQPVMDLRTNRITSCEMLARWIRPNGETISPLRFIPLAEDNHRIQKITWQLMEKMFVELRDLFSSDPKFTAAVNISPKHFLEPEFVCELKKIAAKFNVPNSQICLEITERQEFDDLDQAAARVAELKREGFKVALDDVGIGHSGLSNLQVLRANVLKIDKFFIDSINEDETAGSIVEMLVRLGAKLDMLIVAEGIEQQAQIETLKSYGIKLGQGYAFSPPVDGATFKALIEEQTKSANRTRAA